MKISSDIFSLIALGLSLSSLIFTVLIFIRVNRFFKKGDGKSFEGTIQGMLENMSSLNDFHKELSAYLKIIETRLRRSMQVSLSKRYNPFKGTGEAGQQSHSTILVSENGYGVILSTLATRDRVSVFSKPIKNFSSGELELTPEEKEILGTAKNSLNS